MVLVCNSLLVTNYYGRFPMPHPGGPEDCGFERSALDPRQWDTSSGALSRIDLDSGGSGGGLRGLQPPAPKSVRNCRPRGGDFLLCLGDDLPRNEESKDIHLKNP